MELETANAEAVASASETPSPVETQAPVVETPEPSREQQEAALDAELSQTYRKLNPDRAEDGRFRSREPAEPAAESAEGVETEEKVQEPETEPAEQAKPAIEPPVSWTREAREKWSQLSPELQEFIAKRESDAHGAITRLGQKASELEPVANVLEQHRDLFQKRNMSYEAGVQQLLQTQRVLENNPAAAIKYLADKFHVDLGQFVRGEGQPESDGNTALHQRIAQLESQIAQTSNVVYSREQAEQQARESVILNEANEFLQDKGLTDSDYEVLLPIVAAERQLSPNKATKDILQSAYETFQYRSPERRQLMLAKQQAEQEAARQKEAAKKAEQAKKLGSINVKSTPVKGASARTWDEELSDTFRQMNAR